MVIVSLLLAMPAFACDDAPHDVLAVTPEDGASGVPRDTRVVLQVRGDDVLGEPTLQGPTGPVPGVWRVEDIEGGVDALWTFVPDVPLEQGTLYGLGATEAPTANASDGTAWNAGFVTGQAFGEPAAGIPTLELVNVGQATDGVASRCEPLGFRRVLYQVSPAPDARPSEAWFLLALEDPTHERLLEVRRLDSRAWDTPAEILVPTDGGPFCLVAVQRSASGDEVRSEPACFAPGGPVTLPDATVRGSGCAYAPAGSGVLGGLGLLALASLGIRRTARRGTFDA